MKLKKAFLFSIVLLTCALTTAAAGGQDHDRCSVREPVKCKSKVKTERTFKYKMGLTFRSQRALYGPAVTVIQVSVEPEHINQDDLLKIAGWLKQDFCKERRLSVVILTDRRYVDVPPTAGTLWYRDWLEALRGEYFLDKDSGEEYISYSTTPNYFKSQQSRVKIDLGNPQAEMKIGLSRNSLPRKE
jgi:hypothetical protein